MSTKARTALRDSLQKRRTKDAEPQRSPFLKSRQIELRYVRTLRNVARAVGEMIAGFGDPLDDPTVLPKIESVLGNYARLIEPWAESVGARMIEEANQQDETAWRNHARTMSRLLRAEILTAPTGHTMRQSLARQVVLIKSLPTEAAERVHKLTLEGITQGTRASEIAKEIARSGEVTKSRATLIARTEVARTSSELTQARARHIGSDGYVWETSRDPDVRPSHRKMQGRFVDWNDPPTLDGLTGHAGCLPNCRCWPRPLIPDPA